MDESPRYGEREATGGRRVVNTNIFDTKEAIRGWTGGGYTVHSADTAHTAARELFLLFGRDPQTWLADRSNRSTDGIIPWREDPIATDGWRSIRQLYEALGWCTEYVDLDGGHSSADVVIDGTTIRLLTLEYKEVLSVLAARPATAYLPMWGGAFTVTIDGRDIPIDVRSHRDAYIDGSWANAIVDRRVRRPNGAFTPIDRDLFESFLYEVLVHKPGMSISDVERLDELGSRTATPPVDGFVDESVAAELLRSVMAGGPYSFTKPLDRGVYYNHRVVGSDWPRLRTWINDLPTL